MKTNRKKLSLIIFFLLVFGFLICLFIPKLDRIAWRVISIAEFETFKILSKFLSKPEPKPMQSQVNIASHRGVSSEVVLQNSPHSITLAAQKGFHYIELDISFSKDFVPFIFHDSSLKYKTNLDKLTSEAYWNEIQGLKMLDDQKILSLRDFFFRHGDLFEGVIFDIKTKNNHFSEKAKAFCKAIDNIDIPYEIYVIGRPCGVLAEIKRINPDLKIGCENQGVFYNFITGKNIISLNYFTQFSILEYDLAQKLGLTSILWTVNNPDDLLKLKYLKNCIVLTDMDSPIY
jgi:glycerophosphoryl diester phosphodiesterase